MKENLNIKEIELIYDAFDEKRRIIGHAPHEMTDLSDDCYQGGEFFITEEGELIDLEYQYEDFDEVELVKYIELAENLYEINGKLISIYILCPKDIRITAPECTIKSDAEFNIRLACYNQDPANDMLNYIQEKVNKNIKLNNKDIEALSMIPMMAPKEERSKLRIECLRILNKSQRRAKYSTSK